MSEHRGSQEWMNEAGTAERPRTSEVVERMRAKRGMDNLRNHSCALACIMVNEMKGEIV